ncbi:hypothetical protein [Cetobacterium sp.]|uniref:hypothetical protein n=1 Tax=Cetobacterium sp. TaxID=2071632 RepID=UPI002FC5E497
MSECFFRKIGYDRTNCFLKYKKNNQATTNDYKKYYYESDYNSFTGIINPESKKEEYLNIYNYLNFILETNEKINLILKIYSKILK